MAENLYKTKVFQISNLTDDLTPSRHRSFMSSDFWRGAAEGVTSYIGCLRGESFIERVWLSHHANYIFEVPVESIGKAWNAAGEALTEAYEEFEINGEESPQSEQSSQSATSDDAKPRFYWPSS